MIDPLEAVIVFLDADAGLAVLVEERIAGKHRYGEAWTVGEAGLAVTVDGGAVDLYVPQQKLRVECRCYAQSQAEAMRVWMRLVKVGRERDREVVATSTGVGYLLYWLQGSGPSLVYDSEVGMDVCLGFFDACIGEEVVA